jgi:hypothetical protein
LKGAESEGLQRTFGPIAKLRPFDFAQGKL